jgi:hypothetical protein
MPGIVPVILAEGAEQEAVGGSNNNNGKSSGDGGARATPVRTKHQKDSERSQRATVRT